MRASLRDRRLAVPPVSDGPRVGRARPKLRTGLSVVGLALAVALAPRPLRAAAPDQPLPTVNDKPPPSADGTSPESNLDRAMEAYRRGTENYNLAQYEAALADFKEAASLYASADFQYNIGLCYEKLGKNDEAIRAFATYLKAKPNAEDRLNVEDRIRELREDIERDKREAEARKKTEEQQAPRQAEAVPRDQSPPDDTSPPPSGRGLVLTGAALAGLGGAVALGGGIALGVLASGRSGALEDVQTGGNPEQLTFAEAQQLEADGKRFEAIQVGMVAGGAVVAVTGAVLLAVGLRRRSAVQASAWLGPRGTGLALRGRF